MTPEDTGPTANQLWGLAWVLGLFSPAAWLRIAFLLERSKPVDLELGLWLGGAFLAAVS